MSSVYSTAATIPKKSYISTGPLSVQPDEGDRLDHVHTFTKSYNPATYTWSGDLSGVNFLATPYTAYNQAGTVFCETGKKLYPDASLSIDKYMVGVFIMDENGNAVANNVSLFIDPNCSVFAQFNGQRPTYLPIAIDDEHDVQDLGNPVYTLGNITTTQGDVNVEAGDVNVTGNIAATGSILSSGSASGIGYSTGAGLAPATGANSVTCNTVCGQVSFSDVIPANSYVNWVVNNSRVDANDVVIVNLVNNESVLYSVVNKGAGAAFTIRILNTTGSDINNDLTFNFAVIKSVIS